MKIRMPVLAMFLIAGSHSSLNAQAVQPPLVVIDAGHGGADAGATTAGIVEKNLTLAIANDVASALRQAGFRVLLTRTGDATVELRERAAAASTADVAAFVSIHAGASADPTLRGTRIYMPPNDDASRALAVAVSGSLRAAGDLPVLAPEEANFLVFRGVSRPRILLEVGYVSNAQDAALIDTAAHRATLAAALVAAVPHGR